MYTTQRLACKSVWISFCLSCSGPLVFLLPNIFRLFGFKYFGLERSWWLWAFLMTLNVPDDWAFLMTLNVPDDFERSWWLWVFLMTLCVPDDFEHSWWRWAFLMTLSVPDDFECSWWLSAFLMTLSVPDDFESSWWTLFQKRVVRTNYFCFFSTTISEI